MTYNQKFRQILNDPSVHNWIRNIIPTLDNHDPVDLIADIELLSELFNLKWREMKQEFDNLKVANINK